MKDDDIRKYFNMEWYPECLYLLAMLDYISAENKVSLCTKYDDIRRCKLEEIIYPSSILALASVLKSDDVKKRRVKKLFQNLCVSI
ncbi:MAG: hypothetical protein Q4F88_02180 [Eubacteriales bacterium]|nr:hypothetical protein [Eubacteriales bacterium]